MGDCKLYSLNPEKGLGVASLSVVYGCLIMSSLFLPPIIIKKIGCKWTIVASMCCYVTYSIGNFKPNWYSLIITSAILGIGGGPLWASKCTYLTISGIKYAHQTGKEKMDVVNQYFGIFFLIYQSSGIWGNLISSLVLNQNQNKVHYPKHADHVEIRAVGMEVFLKLTLSEAPNNISYSYCGANNCPKATPELSNTTTPVSGVSDIMRYTLMGIYTGSGVIAVLLIVIFLDQIDLSEEQKREDENPTIWNSLLGTIKQLKDIRQCLLIPLTMFSGFQQGFLSSDYTKAYITCALGIHFVGYVMICYGATNSISSMASGKLSQYTGRISLFMLAAAVSISCIIALLLWSPNPDQLAVFFIFPALWSLSDAICQTLLNAFYGVLFDDHKEAAFANYRLWESLGFVISFAYSNYLCVSVKLYIVLSILLIGMILYLVVEYLEYRKHKIMALDTNAVNMTES
ncbi:protein unc-93 homolog A-like isoform X3 [Engystomops pustulosus]|uniref:protein unc-93 homolog A-like isoform X3 n=1 Tax=Engystomops pustulosus TaxID=76066 RepID=UPI003AFA5D90